MNCSHFVQTVTDECLDFHTIGYCNWLPDNVPPWAEYFLTSDDKYEGGNRDIVSNPYSSSFVKECNAFERKDLNYD